MFPGTPDPIIGRLVSGALHAGDLETYGRHSVEACGLVEHVACVVVLALYAIVIWLIEMGYADVFVAG